MLQKRADFQAVEELAQSDLRSACARARELVAKDPADEDAARPLKETVERFAREKPSVLVDMPDDAPDVAQARDLVTAEKLEEAEILLRQHLKTAQHDPAAMHLMAEIA